MLNGHCLSRFSLLLLLHINFKILNHPKKKILRKKGVKFRVVRAGKQYHTEELCSDAQSCVTLHDSMDYSPPGSSVHGIFQARILEWVAISSSRKNSEER